MTIVSGNYWSLFSNYLWDIKWTGQVIVYNMAIENMNDLTSGGGLSIYLSNFACIIYNTLVATYDLLSKEYLLSNCVNIAWLLSRPQKEESTCISSTITYSNENYM